MSDGFSKLKQYYVMSEAFIFEIVHPNIPFVINDN